MRPASARRLLHASSALVLVLYFFDSPDLVRNVLMGCAAVAVSLDVIRLRMPAFAAFVTGLVPVFRATESNKLSGATWLSVGYALASWFPHPAMTAGILAGAFADPAASWAGSKLRRSTLKKTWVGSGVALAVAVVVIFPVVTSWNATVAAAAAAMVLERWSRPLNDNLVIAPGTALVVWLIL